MQTFDRTVLVVLAVGVWALVLAPQEIGAHHKDDIVSHSCGIDGSAYGVTTSFRQRWSPRTMAGSSATMGRSANVSVGARAPSARGIS